MNTLLTLHDPETARRHYIDGLWRRDTMYSLARDHASERPRAFALRDAGRRLTWTELVTWADAVAAALDAAGVRRGQRVAAWLPSRAETVVAFLACSRNGYVYTPLHPEYGVEDVVAVLGRIEAAALFVRRDAADEGTTAAVVEAARALPGMKRVYGAGEDPASGAAFAAAFPPPSAPAGPVRPMRAPLDDPDKVVHLAFTSGAWGAPKGVMHSDNTLLANGRALVGAWRHDRHTVLLTLFPTSHYMGTVAIEQMLVAGLELVTNEQQAVAGLVDWVVESGATYLMGTPAHAATLLRELRRRKTSRLGDVRVFYMAGGPLPREVVAELLDRGITPQNVYGTAETGAHLYTSLNDERDAIAATCGRPCHGAEVRLWDHDDRDSEVAPGDVGEIGGRGACLMLGYFANQPATEAAFNRFGWFMSGDLGRLDEGGAIEVVGRSRDVITRAGRDIHPAAIEALAVRNAAVAQAAAFAVEDERLGESICLAVVPAEGARADGRTLLAHLHEAGLSRYDMPEWFVALEELPRSASGKILKRELVEWVRSGRIRPEPVRWSGQITGGDERGGTPRET